MIQKKNIAIFLMIRNLSIIKVIIVPKKKTLLNLYLEEPRLNKKQNSKLEILPWWKEHYNQFLEISQLELQFASIDICSAKSTTNIE